MEKMIQTSPKTAVLPENNPLEHESPLQNHSIDLNSKTCTPDRLHLPKQFKHPKRYTSPTDLMMSPISKCILARSRKIGPLLPPTNNQHRIDDPKFPGAGLFQLLSIDGYDNQ